MTHAPATQRQLNAFKRFLKLLPHGQDLTLVILKGNLLIEEQVRQIIDERVKKPEALVDGGREVLGYRQAICLAEAFCPEERGIWKAAAILNEIRNKLAHKTEPVGVDQKIDDFNHAVPGLDQPLADRQNQFELKLWLLFEAVSSLVERPTPTMLALRKRDEDDS